MESIYIPNIQAFDAAKTKNISFGYSGTQCIKNKITIYNNETNTITFENTVTSFSLSHLIQKNTLINGDSYYCIFTAYYMVGNVEHSITSSPSNVFKCLSTPSWSLNISDEGIIGNSYFTFIPSYFQAQNETVNEYCIVLYTTSGSEFWSSGIIYGLTKTTVSNLPNDTVLYVRAYGTTTNGLYFDTRNFETGNDIRVSVDYISPTVCSLAYVENNKWQGWVKVSTDVASVEGHTKSEENAIFIDNKYVNLSNESIIFDKNFMIKDDFILEKLFYDVVINKPSLKIKGLDLAVIITFRKGIFDVGGRFYAELKIADLDYVLYSNMIQIPNSTDMIHLWVQRSKGLYKIVIANLGVV